ncbi:S24 family peptidase [Paraburkholderia sp. D15]|uniref:LexA family protein n=1 Tax=Paraburkholderia sp. D15 TaxID=2880218 RepID=UPI002478F2AA|nr:S24 family peptidase [Paraburkholderia sp. D15]WGS53544.1 S24 family peptidase [Paraburkholderia sp. D15]
MNKAMHETAKRLFSAAKKVRPEIEGPADLARALNQSEQTINNWSYRGNGVSKVGRLAAQKILGISATWIEDGTGDVFAGSTDHKTHTHHASITASKDGVIVKSPTRQGRNLDDSNTEPGPDIKGKYPLISWVQAGAWETIVDNFAPGDAEAWLGAPVSVSKSSYYLRVRGESMYDPAEPKSFRHGELALIDPHAPAVNGSLVVVRLDDEAEATFKQLIIEGDRKYLKALNPNWPNRIFEVNGNASICGVVKGKFVGGY